MRDKLSTSFEKIFKKSAQEFEKIHKAREIGLSLSREIIGISSRAIRSAHRGEFNKSQEQIDLAMKKLSHAKPQIAQFAVDINSAFLLDAEKEICESIAFISFLTGKPIPQKYAKSFSPSSWLKGMAEAASELRRSALDRIRSNSVSDSEKYLDTMNEIVDMLESVDFPEGVTSGLRRTTDQLRSVVERTRGDITIALERKDLEKSIESLKRDLTQ